MSGDHRALVTSAALVIASHQRVKALIGHPCWCKRWPDSSRDTLGYHEHVAEMLANAGLLATPPEATTGDT